MYSLLLSSQKIEPLNKLGFAWDQLHEQWKNTFEELKKYYIENGHTSVSRNTTESKSLKNNIGTH